jgi:hypothetical protein
MTSRPSTSRSARSSDRAALLDALVQPLNVLLPVGLVVAGALTGAAWLTLVAIFCWLVLVGMTYRDARRRPPPAPALAPAIAVRVEDAVAACAGVRQAIAASGLPLDDVAEEVDGLLGAIRANAARAQPIHAFLAAQPRAEPAVMARVRARFDALLAEIDHVTGTLQTMQAEILAADDDVPALAPSLASQVAELRVKARITASGLEESVAETRVGAGVVRATQGP